MCNSNLTSRIYEVVVGSRLLFLLFEVAHSFTFVLFALGKSTLMSALSGKLPLLSGARIEGDGLELGAFTQDLAQVELCLSSSVLFHMFVCWEVYVRMYEW